MQDTFEKKLKFIPLGGNGLVTKNMYIYEYDGKILIVDCGMGFPSAGMPGIDLIIPDISYLKDKKDKIRGIFITHGHEDHIGALPYLLKELAAPVYATKLTIGLIKVRLQENDVLRFASLNIIEPREKINLDPFTVEAFRVSHSVPDSVGYAITTPVGTTIHTGDFKFDKTPLDGKPTDDESLRRFGENGVLCLMTDCLRSEKPGYTLSETNIEKSFEEQFKTARGRVLITTFSSNISRIQQAINVSFKYGRKIGIVGRSMENNILVARDLGYLTLPKEIFVKKEEINNTPDNKLTLLISGSQGQAESALVRIAGGNHSFIYVKENDLIIFSADPIPGNQDAVYALIDDLTELGAEVIYSDISSEFHVSGHGAQEELLLMLSLVKPKFVVPISGMYRQMKQYAYLAERNGYDKKAVFIMNEGEVLELTPNEAKFQGSIDTSDILVDGLGVGDIGNVVLRDRKVLAEEGVVLITVVVNRRTGKLVVDPDIVSRGFVYVKESEKLIKDSVELVKVTMADIKVRDWRLIKNRIVEKLEKFLFTRTKRRPMVLPVVIEV